MCAWQATLRVAQVELQEQVLQLQAQLVAEHARRLEVEAELEGRPTKLAKLSIEPQSPATIEGEKPDSPCTRSCPLEHTITTEEMFQELATDEVIRSLEEHELEGLMMPSEVDSQEMSCVD